MVFEMCICYEHILICTNIRLELQRAANETNYGNQGLVVVHAAMAREDGVVPFDSGLRNKAGAGVENIGISVSGNRWELPGNYPFFTMTMIIYH